MVVSALLVVLLAQPAELSPAPTPGQTATYAVATTGVLLGTSAVAVGLGVLVHSVPFDVDGRPNTWVTTGALALAVGAQFALAHLLVPTVAAAVLPQADRARLRTASWEMSRWTLAAGGVGVLTYGVGAALEQSAFGRGQAVLVVGVLLSVLSFAVADVLEGLAVWSAAR